MSKLAKFAFARGDRVIVPGNGALQGVVSGRKDMIGRESEYDVHFLNPDLSLSHVVCGESALVAAQPTPAKSRKR